MQIPFDSSYLRNAKPERLYLGRNALYTGFEMALSSMTVGEKAEFLIHPDLAFGSLGSPGRIPPNATILVILWVLKTFKDSGFAEKELLSLEDRKDFTKVYKLAKAINSEGNFIFKFNAMQAAGFYRKAENLLNGCSLKNDDEEKKWKCLMVKILLNSAIAYNNPQMKFPRRALTAVKKALEIAPRSTKSTKLYYNKGAALVIMGENFQALQAFKKARSLSPDSIILEEQIKKIEYELRVDPINDDEAIGFFPRVDSWAGLQIHDSTDDEFKAAATQLLQDFVSGDRQVLRIAEPLTDEEKKFLKDEAHCLKLIFSDISTGFNKSVIIIGKSEPITGSQ